MKKTLISLFLCLLIFLYAKRADCAEISPEQHVKNFYTWYINLFENQKLPLKNEDIYKYVDRCTVTNVYLGYMRSYFDVGYFTKSQDLWKEWLDVFTVHKSIKINNTTSIVPISFELAKNNPHNLVVFVNNEKGKIRITKVISASKIFE